MYTSCIYYRWFFGGAILLRLASYLGFIFCWRRLQQRREDIQGWDKEFVDVDLATLFHMILVSYCCIAIVPQCNNGLKAANFLDVKSMLDLTCKAVAHSIRGKNHISWTTTTGQWRVSGKKPDEIKAFFGIQGDFTPEEVEAVLKEVMSCCVAQLTRLFQNEWLREKPVPATGGEGPAAGGAPAEKAWLHDYIAQPCRLGHHADYQLIVSKSVKIYRFPRS